MNATHALGWALVHFLWQGTALALLLGIALAFTRPTAARTRYTLSLLTLIGMLVVPVVTGLRAYKPAFVVDVAPAPAQLDVAPATRSAGVAEASRTVALPTGNILPAGATAAALLDPALPWLVVIWVGGVILLSVRLGHGWMTARRLRTHGTRATSAMLRQVLDRLATRLRVTRPVQLLESLVIEVPAVIGWLRPVILVPTSALTGLTPQQLELLLAHELAHVRRYDYLMNIVQCVIETLLFYHPAVWWVSQRIRNEREHCCDDLVVQVCGDRHLYATALVEMERIRSAPPGLALAATGGSLLHRVRRLILPTATRAEFFPRWAAGVAGVIAVTVALLATGSDRVSGEPTGTAVVGDTLRAKPDTVVLHPDPSQPLAQRFDWARNQAKQMSRRTFWIGYRVPRPSWLEHSVYVDRGAEVKGDGITISGRMFGDFQGFMFRGARLGPLTGSGDSDDIAIVLGFTDQGGRATLNHVHVASFYLPIDFHGRTLFWLGTATDAQSLPMVDGLFTATTQAELREDIVSAIGVHGSSDAVIPILLRILSSQDPANVRSQAAEWLGVHPSAAAVVALSRAARTDLSGDVRREAAEALAESTMPAATDSTIAIAKTATDPDARREAVEGLGQKDSDRALAALVAIAQTDRDEDVQRAAVETLGEMPGGRGLNAVRDIARSHPRPDVRREAIETLGENLAPAEALELLKTIATSDPDPDVRRGAVETIGEKAPPAQARAILSQIARGDHDADVRRAAVETLGETGNADSVIEILDDLAGSNDADAAREAVETLGDMHSTRALARVARIARRTGDTDVRRQAIETYGESAPTDSALVLFKAILGSEAPDDIYSAVLDALEELHGGAGIPALIDVARSNPNRDLRSEALRRLADSDDPRAQQVFDQTLRRP